jgi:hypothetical protein
VRAPSLSRRRPQEARHRGAGCPRMAMAIVGVQVPEDSRGEECRQARPEHEGMPDTGRRRPGRKRFRPKKILIGRCTAGIDRATLLDRKSREGIRGMQDRCVMLRAVNTERNVNRSWVCRIERDLFGACVVSVTFGRAGTLGRTIRRMVLDDAAADRFLAGAMARRRGSMKRCGAAYRIIEARGFDGGDSEMAKVLREGSLPERPRPAGAR